MKEYFKELDHWLKVEKSVDEEQYKELFEKASISERRAAGLTWYPVAIRGQELQRTDYLVVELERTTNQDVRHSFRVGSPVVFFSNHNSKEDKISGTITFQSDKKVRILIKDDELPEWSSDGKLGLDLAFDNQSYQEMFNAIKNAPTYKIAEEILDSSSLKFDNSFAEFKSSKLNDSQNLAVNKILGAKQLAIVHGPPGTGKTTTMVEAIVALNRAGAKKILVTAPSNTAVDLLAEKLSEHLNVLRIGNPARVSEALNALTLEDKIAKSSLSKDVKKMRIQANEFRKMAHKYKRNFGKSEREQRKALFDEAYRILKEIEDSEKYISEKIFDETQVFAATLVGSAHYTIKDIKFDAVIIDEAGQALEPACWIPILKSEKVVLAGDQYQLPPTIKSQEAANKFFGKTLLEKLSNQHPDAVVMLDTQYRMNEKIAAFSSFVFYKNQLKAHDSVKNQTLQNLDPFYFIDTAGCGFEEVKEGTSLSNPEEAAFLIKRVEQFLEGKKGLSIGIISPYKQQLKYLEEFAEGLEVFADNKVSINTIDSFQGQERDTVFISTTRSNTDSEIGFLSDTRRMNVAMTRAKKLLVLVGDSSTISQNSFYADLIKYAEEKATYQSAWEYL